MHKAALAHSSFEHDVGGAMAIMLHKPLCSKRTASREQTWPTCFLGGHNVAGAVQLRKGES